MKAQPTSGPYRVEDHGYPLEVLAPNGLEVCRVGGSPDCPPEDDENQANACLLAASWEMRESMRALVASADATGCSEDLIVVNAAAVDAARKLLARIEGA